jgi:hypothetical protein
MKRVLLAAWLAAAVHPCLAADAEPATRSEVEELRREVADLKAQIRALKEALMPPAAAVAPAAGQAPPTAAAAAPSGGMEQRSSAGTPAAGIETKSAQAPSDYANAATPLSNVSFWGYGELNYNHYVNDTSRNQADLRRFVIGVAYEFNDRLHFNSEVEWEHAVTSAVDRGETEIEQAYLEYQATPQLSGKGGLFLMPFGFLNEHHEPPVFYGVERNEVETRIIPSTWREGGFGLKWATDNGITYEAGITTGFDVSKFDDPSAPLFSMHQELQLAHAHDLSYHGAINYRGVLGLQVGGAVFTGNSTQGNAAFKADSTQPDFAALNGRVTLWEVHARWQPGPLDLQAIYARGLIGDADRIDRTLDAFNQATGSRRAFVPDSFNGWYGQVAYKVWERNEMSLTPFFRYEYYNTQSSMPAGFLADPANASHVATTGLTYRLHPQVVIKADYQKFVEHSDNNRVDLGLGYMF